MFETADLSGTVWWRAWFGVHSPNLLSWIPYQHWQGQTETGYDSGTLARKLSELALPPCEDVARCPTFVKERIHETNSNIRHPRIELVF